MKGLFIAFITLSVGNTFSQTASNDSIKERECLRMRYLAGQELKIKNYKAAASYYLKGEKICGNYDAKQYGRLVGTLRNSINQSKEKAEKKAYTDTLLGVYSRMDSLGLYNKKDDLLRASYILQSSNVDRELADQLFRRGVETQGTATPEGYVSYFYYNTYMRFHEAPQEKKSSIKEQLIEDYFNLSKLISQAKMSAKTQEAINKYFNAVVKTCDDIVPELNDYMNNLPEDPEVRKEAVLNFIQILEDKNCIKAPEYGKLIDTYVSIDPNSIDAQLMKSKYLTATGKYSSAIQSLKKAKELATTEEEKQKITYQIAYNQFKAHQYGNAYRTAMSIKGDLRGDALVLAARSVAGNANNCGVSTFERGCNYLYAVQLLEQARQLGKSVGGDIAKYRKRVPSKDDCFQNGNPASVELSCYGVTVHPCK